jgi:hypothetical protein
MAKIPRLSKSRIVKGLQCPKALYLSVHQPELAAEADEAQEMIFAQGNEVGIEAHKRFPGGVLITAPHLEHELAIQQTKAAITGGALAIFEATFEHEGVLVKVDILHRKTKRSAWEISEVKSSTSVKEVHLQDVAVQLWAARGCLPAVTRAHVLVINNDCEHPNLSELLKSEDVTSEAEALIPKIISTAKALRKMLTGANAPLQEIGPHCSDPYGCEFQENCWAAAGVTTPSVFDLPRLSSERKWDYFRAGAASLTDLDPAEFNAIQARVIDCTVGKKRYVAQPEIALALKEWKFPLSFLDFETIATAMPRHKGTRPYQALPFQFSCHIRRKPGGKLEHAEYLHNPNTDPRAAIAAALCEAVPKKGSIVAYNKGTEGGILRKLAGQFPKYRAALTSMAERLVDPLPIFRSHVYDPAFNGSFSIKFVAPALLGKDASYEGLSVAHGQAAQAAYLALLGEGTSAEEKKSLREGLIQYCKKDTYSMVMLAISSVITPHSTHPDNPFT